MNNEGKITIMFLRSGLRNVQAVMGGELVILNIARNLDRRKYFPVIAAITENEEQRVPLLEAAAEYGIQAERVVTGSRFGIFKGTNRLIALLKHYNARILHCNEYKSNLLGWFAAGRVRVRLITTVHGWVGGNIRLSCYEFFDKLIIRFFDKIIAVSVPLATELKRLKGIKEKLQIIHNALDVSQLRLTATKEEVRRRMNIDAKTRVIGTIGRLSPEKGQCFFIEAAEEIAKNRPDTHFIIVGGGMLRQKLEKQARESGLSGKFSFLGVQPNPADYLQIMDVFVFPSLKETFGLALLEAMLMEKPIVCTAVGIAQEIIKNGENGIIVPAKDSHAVCETVLSLLADEKKANELGKQAFFIAREKLSVEKMIKEYERIYAEIA